MFSLVSLPFSLKLLWAPLVRGVQPVELLQYQYEAAGTKKQMSVSW